MAISQSLPPPDPPTIHTEYSSSDGMISSASTSDTESSSPYPCEAVDGVESHGNVQATSMRSRPRTYPRSSASLRVPPTCCKKSSAARSARGGAAVIKQPNSIACLRQHLASLRSLLPPSAKSSQASNVVADALRYKKVLREQIQMLQKALPYAQQVNVKRLGSGGLQIGVACNKEPGLLVALMEAIESFGLTFANVNVSCLNEKIRINAISHTEIGERIGSLKVALMATIRRFSQQQTH